MTFAIAFECKIYCRPIDYYKKYITKAHTCSFFNCIDIAIEHFITTFVPNEHFTCSYFRWGESKTKKGTMSYIDFVWFLISEEDKKLPTSIEYWFRCMDLDGDGVISLYEMEYFYEEQIRKLELLDIEALPFEDCVCQMLDMIKPAKQEYVSLKDLKNSQMAYLFFDTFLNIEKYLEHEQKDPFANNPFGEDSEETPLQEQSEWEKYAAEEYENLVAEEQANDNRSPDNHSYEDEVDPTIEAELRNLGLIGDEIPSNPMHYNGGESLGVNKKLAAAM